MSVLTSEQRDTLLQNTSDRISKLGSELEQYRRIHLETFRVVGGEVGTLLNQFSNAMLQAYVNNENPWSGKEVVKLIDKYQIPANEEQRTFIDKHGIPSEWTRLFKHFEMNDVIRVDAIPSKLDISDDDAWRLAIGLAAIGLLQFSWIDNRLYFRVQPYDWISELNDG